MHRRTIGSLLWLSAMLLCVIWFVRDGVLEALVSMAFATAGLLGTNLLTRRRPSKPSANVPPLRPVEIPQSPSLPSPTEPTVAAGGSPWTTVVAAIQASEVQAQREERHRKEVAKYEWRKELLERLNRQVVDLAKNPNSNAEGVYATLLKLRAEGVWNSDLSALERFVFARTRSPQGEKRVVLFAFFVLLNSLLWVSAKASDGCSKGCFGFLALSLFVGFCGGWSEARAACELGSLPLGLRRIMAHLLPAFLLASSLFAFLFFSSALPP